MIRRVLNMGIAISLLLGCADRISAQQVDIATAQNAARRALQGDIAAPSSTSSTLAWDSTDLFATTRSHGTEPTFYVFATEGGRGFVIVAADKRISPILGYSDTYAICNPENLPQNMVSWLEYVDSEVRDARISEAEIHPEWNDIPTRSNRECRVLETATWSQGEPYNRQCPMEGKERTLTGCTATATGIIMHYHRWPESAWGIAPAYQTPTTNIAVEQRDITHTYEWDNMLMGYPEGAYNDTQANAVATLLADLGHVYQANYGYLGTSALPNIEWLIKNFQYSPGINYQSRNSLSKQTWDMIMRNEIDANRPILFSGYDKQQIYGHAFVIDGYDDNNFFHVNWGWEGLFNGFYRLEDLRPNNYDFSYDQWILVGLEPYREKGDFPNWISVVGDIEVNKHLFVENETFMVIEATYINNTQEIFNGVVRLAHTDKVGNIKGWLTDDIAISELRCGYSTTLRNIECTITEPIEDGDRMRTFYRASGDEWIMVNPYEYYAGEWEIVFRSCPQSIAESTSISFNKDTEILTIAHDSSVTVDVSHNGTRLSDITYEANCTIINTKKHHGKSLDIRLENSVEERTLTITINRE